MNKEQPIFFHVRPAAQKLGFGEKFLRKEIKAGRVPGIQIGTQFMVDINLYIEQLRHKDVSA